MIHDLDCGCILDTKEILEEDEYIKLDVVERCQCHISKELRLELMYEEMKEIK